MTKTMVDSAYPQNFPVTDVVLIYAGGDTPHPWTDTEIAAQKARWRLPCWVRSNPQQVNVQGDIDGFVAWLQAHGVPKGSATLLDLETAVDAAYVNAFGAGLHAAGYLVLPYGSLSTIFGNPALDGVFTAHYTGAQHFCPGTIGTQWIDDTMLGKPWDLSVVADSVPLWDTQPPPVVPPAAGSPITFKLGGQDMAAVPFNLTTDPTGHFDMQIPLPAGCSKVVAVSVDLGSVYAGQWDPAENVVAQPAVGNPHLDYTKFGEIYVKGAPNHFYTGHAICA